MYKDLLQGMQKLRKAGIPIFTKEFNQLQIDIFRSMYYAVKAQLPNSNLIFPYDAGNAIDVCWLVDSDDFGLCDSIPHLVDTHYERGNETNNYETKISVYDGGSSPVSKLSEHDILTRWDMMKQILPQEEFEKYGNKFDICKWYKVMSHSIF